MAEKDKRGQKKGNTQRKMAEARTPAETWEGENKERTDVGKEQGGGEIFVPFVAP